MDEPRENPGWLSLGRWLRQAREAKGCSLAEVEQATRIRRKFLAALEAGQWKELPSEVVGRGFLRNYARFLGLDPQEAHRRLSGGEPPTPPEPPPSRREDREETEATPDLPSWKREAAPLPPPPVVEEQPADYALLEESLFEPRRIPWLRIVGSLLLVLLLAAVGLVSWLYWNNPQLLVNLGVLPPTASPTATTEMARVTRISATPSDTPTVTPTPTDTPTLRPSRTPTPAETATPTVRPTPAEGLEAFVHVTDRSWLEVFSDGERAFVGLLEPGDDQAWQAQRQIRMTIGNAGGLELTINGERVGFLGARDEVVHVAWELEEGGRILQMRITPTAETPTGEGTPQREAETVVPEETAEAEPATPEAESTPSS
jgi:cytoskeletal protein RodZ